MPRIMNKSGFRICYGSQYNALEIRLVFEPPPRIFQMDLFFNFLILNILGFWICQGYTRFLIKYFVMDVCQYSEYPLDSEYAMVLNMLESHKWIKFSMINIWQGSEYTSSSENTNVTQAFVESSPSYMLGRFLSIPWALNLPGLEYTRVLSMPRLHMVLRKLYFKDSQYFECLEFWIC